jgi:polysaccharide deacetylase family protein (PEP-CTERM system associated)
MATAAPDCIFSVDVEDWFHILDVPATPPLADWSGLPSRVERNFHHLLDLFDTRRVHVTCFFLAWVAERFPQLVREAVRRGHEVASHGYAHRLVYELGERGFGDDARKARQILEDVAGCRVLGYRAAGFSTNHETPWFFDRLAEAGYVYDSSVFPTERGHGGLPGAPPEPHVVRTAAGPLVEFPISVASVGGRRVCFFGGGYLRIFPYPVVRRMAGQVRREGRPVVFYVHPREVDRDHPRLPMKLTRRFKSYVNLRTTEAKIVRLLEDFPVTTFASYLQRHALAEMPA